MKQYAAVRLPACSFDGYDMSKWIFMSISDAQNGTLAFGLVAKYRKSC